MLLADTHVHIYPCHVPDTALAAALQNLGRFVPAQAGQVSKALFLTERSDCFFFRDLRSGAIKLTGFEIERFEGGCVAVLRSALGERLFVFAGRQIVTAERLEVLSLTSDELIADALPIAQVLAQVHAVAAVGVVPWALGKWWFERGRVVADLVLRSKPADFALADSALRPVPFPFPGVLSAALARGFTVLAGSDPLPFAGEEQRVGAFATLFSGVFDEEQPLESARRMLRSAPHGVKRVGRRVSAYGAALKLYKLKREKAGVNSA